MQYWSEETIEAELCTKAWDAEKLVENACGFVVKKREQKEVYNRRRGWKSREAKRRRGKGYKMELLA